MKKEPISLPTHRAPSDGLRILLSITNEEDRRQVEETFRQQHIPLLCELRAKGTAPSEFLDILGLGGTTRILTLGYVRKSQVRDTFRAINGSLSYHRRGTGIAVTLPLNAAQGALVHLLQADAKASAADIDNADYSEEESTMSQSHNSSVPAYSLLLINVHTGYSDAVVDAAREVGARGGTVLHGRRIAQENALQELGFDGQEEQDSVLIVVPSEKKAPVMQAIAEKCGLNTPAHGVIVALPVDDVMGLV